MSHTTAIKRLSITDLQAMKGETPIVSLTAYAAPMAAMIDPHIDCFIVGDSLGMVLYGMESTLPVSMELMIRHGKCVVDHTSHACVIVDMPFGSYQESPQQAFRNASELIAQTGAQAVKLEGGMEMVETVEFLATRGVPVMAHLGLKPQHLNTMGGYKYQGRDADAGKLMMEEAKQMEAAGAFGLLLEGIKESLAADITQAVKIPTIGIGASPACDGQVLVTDDMIGLSERTPKFVKTYANVRDVMEKAIQSYAKDVRTRRFPEEKHCFGVKKDRHFAA